MPKCGKVWQAVVLTSNKKNLTSSMMTQIILILACFCQGMLSQMPGYTLTVPHHVTVQRNSCVHISCQFTYNSGDRNRNEKLFVYWLKIQDGATTCFSYRRPCFPGSLVATTDGRITAPRPVKKHFYSTGDPDQGICSVIIMDAQAEDEGRYYVRIEGDGNLKFSYSKDIYTSPYVSVTDRPQDVPITWTIERPGSLIQQGPVVIQEGENVKLICAADSTANPILTWMKRNNDNGFLGQGREHVISRIKPEDAGEYECRFSSVSKAINVTVQYQPKAVTFRISKRGPILSQGFSQELVSGSQWMAQEGESLQLLCKADSNPSAQIRWTKPGRQTSSKYADNKLELTKLTVEHEGEYVCHAGNTFGSAQGTFQLYVAYAPKLSGDPQRNSTCWHQENGFLCNCTFKAQPPPQIQWQVDEETITEKNHGRNLEVTSLAQGHEVTSILNWTGNLEVDHNIICIGKNSFGIYGRELFLGAVRDSIIKDSSTGSHTAVLISVLCGALLGASFFMLGLLLFKFYKRKAPPKAACDEVVDSANVECQKASNNSLIYSNILPMGQRTPHVGQPKTAGQKNVQQRQIPKVADPTTHEGDGLHYAALEFKLKNPDTSVEKEESVEYSSIRRK